MSPQDSQLLQDFLNQLIQARGLPKDPEADAMIARAVAQQPDAAYLLVQRALLQQQALNNAQAEIAALQQQLRGASRPTPEFLDPNAWGRGGGYQPAPPAPAAHGGAAAQQYYPPAYQQPQASRGGFLGGRMGGMGGALGSIASTAAGVAAGAFLFQGLGNLLGGHHNHDGNGFLGNNDAFSSLTAPLDNLGADSPGGSDSAGSFAENGLTDNDFSGDSGADSFGDDAFGGGDDSMLG
jgi:hypothetical protein